MSRARRVRRTRLALATLASLVSASVGGPAPLTASAAPTASPVIGIAGGTAVEGDALNSDATFMVRLDRPATGPVTFHFVARPGTASPGSDFIRHTRDLTIPAGAVFLEVVIDTVGDTVVEGDETFTGTISAVTGATLGVASATMTILDDDPGPADGLAIIDGDTVEGDVGKAGLSFVVRLSTPQSHPVTMTWRTVDGTAVAGQDYRAESGTLTIPAGGRKARMRVDVLGDTAVERTERFTVRLSDVVGATLTKATGVATILDDD